ncbi:hypothetical protein NECAME_09965 [Necator americanus]|uniref:PPPDE domain-containing protein n=1 Tax=Necator americanus TaxID=51031 RepID=W2TC35_NECAM|nr:hypothetical protein NECAME_09965 [Necator americanus]ETN79159.1 hypothetical protein NECAME_09965 [Necator americanus]
MNITDEVYCGDILAGDYPIHPSVRWLATMARVPVRLNVYDMYWLNDYASNIGFGIFHSGIEVYGVEYAYGGHPYAFSGVFENSPQDAEELGENFKFKQSIIIGETAITAAGVRELIKSLGQEYRGDRYHLISRNCNHFSAVLAKALTGNDIPTWINRLANLSGSIPFLERCLPQEWLTPVALQQSLEDQRNAEQSKQNSAEAQKRLSIDSAEDALDAKLNDSRATVVSARGFTCNDNSSPPSSGIPSRSGSPPSIQRIWAQIKSTMAGDIRP